ncbi:hypothetical protein FSARC_8241 [Fusarium sarcochroum]|uniref:Xylanolytic transcriptional activator regulatory domain-containing protein n=1 Tax=Fusarium sarcochroum TaxID=1208366 RepID=A0A8H4TTM3_9HYPO|nr:hypothetical protein FSARC_8241 [Fusarium sarcochroum]
MSAQVASQACDACRVRLQKTCEYPQAAVQDISGTSNPTDFYSSLKGPEQNSVIFILNFFLDSDQFERLEENALAYSPQSSLQQLALSHVGPDPIADGEAYFSSVHKWLPVISRKRFLYQVNGNSNDDSCLMLLVVCMKLCTSEPGDPAAEFPLYAAARSLCSAAETSGFVTLRLLQSLVLLGLYELSHGVCPGAFLTISRAARLGILMGFHDRAQAPRIFKPAETWTLREEQRRTWFVNIEHCGIPFAVPQPFQGELLPINDQDWEDGKIAPSEPLYTRSFSSVTTVGPFAKMCQAAHMLSKVMSHREARTYSENITELLPEAQTLHQALVALQRSIEEPELGEPADASTISALSICCSARFILYNLYACNEPLNLAMDGPIALATEMQKVGLEGIRELALSTAPRVAKEKMASPFVARFLYHAATECAWFIKEDREQAMVHALKVIVDRLHDSLLEWSVAGHYFILLVGQGIKKLLKEDGDGSSTTTSTF